MPLDITFGWSSSPNYSRAVQLAQNLPGYRASGTGKVLLHQVQTTVSLAQDNAWENLQALLQLVAAWRSTRLRLGGQTVPFWQLSFQVAQVQACYTRKLQLHAGPGYCSGQRAPGDEATHFGCRLTKGVSRKLRPWNPSENSWIRFGNLSAQRDRFRVNKEAIFQALQAETQRQACIYCPAFRWSQVRSQVERLPDELPLRPDSPFEVKYSDLDHNQPLGIRLKTTVGFHAVRAGEPGPVLREPTPPRRRVPHVRYADVAGQLAALAVVRNVVELPLTHPEYFRSLGLQPQSGILLFGPPGNGKTLLAKAVASESQAHFEVINGPEILSKWVGQGEARLRQVFHRARQLAPSVVLIDEPLPPVPKVKSHRPLASLRSVLSFSSTRVPRYAPLTGSKALISLAAKLKCVLTFHASWPGIASTGLSNERHDQDFVQGGHCRLPMAALSAGDATYSASACDRLRARKPRWPSRRTYNCGAPYGRSNSLEGRNTPIVPARERGALKFDYRGRPDDQAGFRNLLGQPRAGPRPTPSYLAQSLLQMSKIQRNSLFLCRRRRSHAALGVALFGDCPHSRRFWLLGRGRHCHVDREGPVRGVSHPVRGVAGFRAQGAAGLVCSFPSTGGRDLSWPAAFTIALLELRPPGRVVAEPLAQLGAGGHVLQPKIEFGALLRQAARSKAFDQNPQAIVAGRFLIGSLESLRLPWSPSGLVIVPL
jgi:hypothetical protein